jgi:hypothetical protein
MHHLRPLQLRMRCHRPRCLAKQRYAPHPGEVEALMEAAMANRHGHRDATMILIAFRHGLSDMGFVEGRNVAIDYRWADNRNDRLPGFAADLVARKVALILAGGASTAVRAAMAATQTIRFHDGRRSNR